ncbi:MAG: hypothetical protein MJ131_10595 [Lachnospiraceae bacterium]|nr:hypothetical protein [Lachnospiraceae bacterium]
MSSRHYYLNDYTIFFSFCEYRVINTERFFENIIGKNFETIAPEKLNRTMEEAADNKTVFYNE